MKNQNKNTQNSDIFTQMLEGTQLADSKELDIAINDNICIIHNVSGGTVEATGEGGIAILNRVAGTVHVSGGTVQVTDKGRSYAIQNKAAGTVNISSGTVEATGNMTVL